MRRIGRGSSTGSEWPPSSTAMLVADRFSISAFVGLQEEPAMASWAGSGELRPCVRRWLCCIRPARRAPPLPRRRPAGRTRRRQQRHDHHRLRRHPYICDALTQTGHLDSDRLLLQTDCPSWLYPVTHGRHHDLGALGLDAARRNHPPWRHDLLQPLRPRRRRRLDAPSHRRRRDRRTRLQPGRGPPPNPAPTSPGPADHCRPPTAWSPSPGRSPTATTSPSPSTCPAAQPPTTSCPDSRR